jgi:hypothetical protein
MDISCVLLEKQLSNDEEMGVEPYSSTSLSMFVPCTSYHHPLILHLKDLFLLKLGTMELETDWEVLSITNHQNY